MNIKPRLAASIVALLVVGAASFAGYKAYSQGPDVPDESGQLVIIAGETTPAAAPVMSEAAGDSVGEAPPARISDALGLGQQARVRNAVRYDEEYDIVCGEVSRTGYETDYRRFVYVGAAQSADIDDGSKDFSMRVRDVCKRQTA